jgi:hypothetical protein
MSRKRHAIHVDTFPFLAVLLCAMGSLILLLLIFDRRAKVVARAKAQENAAQAAARKAKAVDSEDEDWKRKIHQLHELLVQQQLELQNQLRAILGNKAATSQRLQDEEKEILSLHKAIGEQKADLDKKRTELAVRRGVLAKASDQEKAAQKDLERFARELDQLERTLHDLQAVKRRDQETYSLVPYHGKRGANRKPIYVECTAYSLVFHPGGKSLSPLSMTPAEFLAEAVRLGGKLPQKSDSDKEPDSPYVLFLVRPNGIASYYQAQAAMKELNMDFGYEFVEADWVFDFGGEGNVASQPWQSAPTGLASNGSGPVALGTGPGLAGSGSGSGGRILGVPISATGFGPGGNNTGAGPGSGIGWPGNGSGNTVGGAGSGFGQMGVGIAGSGNGSGYPDGGGSGPGGSGIAVSGNGNGWPAPNGSSTPGSGHGSGWPGGGSSSGRGSGIAGSENGNGYPGGGGTSSVPDGSGIPNSANGNTYRGSGSFASGPGGSGTTVAGNGSASPIAGGSGNPGAGSNYGQNGGNSGGAGQTQAPPINPDPWQPSSGQPGNASNPKIQGFQDGGGPPVQIGISSKPGQNPGYQPDESDLDRQRRLYQPGGGGNSGSGNGMAIPLSQATPFANLQKPEKSTKPNIPLGRLIGNRDFILVLECTADAVIIQPWGTRFPLPSLPKEADPSHPLVQTIQQLINRRQATVLPGETPYRPILRFKIRPDGLRAYYLAYPLLEGLRLPMLRENADSP